MKTAASRTALYGAVATVAIVLIAAVGCCLFAADGHDHGAMRVDLCSAMAVVALLVVSVTLGVVGISTERSTWAATPVAVSIPDPPPWR